MCGRPGCLGTRRQDASCLTCPECGGPLSTAAFARLLPPAAAAEWAALEVERTLAALPDVLRCPHCATPTPEEGGERHLAVCPSCGHAFCGLCLGPNHPTTPCVSPETRLEIVRLRLAGGARSAADIAALRRAEHNLASEVAIAASTKRCPCGAAISKDGGCAKVICRVCTRAMCWRCGQDVTEESYSHFFAGRPCALFDAAEVRAWGEAQAALLHPGGGGDAAWLR